MKKNVQKLKLLALVLGMILVYTGVNAQTRTASQNGPWNNPATWGGLSVPNAANDVEIGNFDITVSGNEQAASITLNNGTGGSLAVASGASVSVTNAITLQSSNNSNRAFELTGAGTINCASLIVGLQFEPTNDQTTTFSTSVAILNVSGNIEVQSEDNGTDENNATFNLQSGTVTVGGTIILDEEGGFSSSVLNFTMASGGQSGRLVLTGATPFTIAGSPTVNLVGSSSTVAYTGAAQTVLATTYNNLELSGGAKTTTGVTVNTKLIMNDDVTVSAAPTYSTATIEYAGTVSRVTGTEFANNATVNIEINNTGGVSLPGVRTLNGNLTLTAGTFTAGNNFRFDGGERNITIDAGVYSGIPQSVGTGDDYNVTYIGSSKSTGDELSGAELDDINVSLNAGQTLTLGANRAPDDDITINSGTFDLGAFTLNSGAATQSFTVASGATLRIGGTNSLPTGYNYSFNGSSTTDFYGTVQTINAATYGNLSVNGTSLADIKSLGGNVTVAGNLFVGPNGNVRLDNSSIALSASGNREAWIEGQVNINGNGRLTQSGSGTKTFRLGTFGGGVPGLLYLTDVGNATTIMPLFDIYDMESNSVVYYASTDNQEILGGIQYGNLVAGLDGLGGIPGSGIKTVTSSLEVINSVVINPGVTLACQSGGVNADNIRLGGTWLNAGTFTANDDRVIFDGSSTQELRGPNNTTFNNVEVLKDDATFGMNLLVNTTVTGQVTFTRGFLTTTNGSVLIMNSGSSVTGASDNSYAECPVRKIGATAFTFPSGKNGQYSPVTITAPGEAGDAFQAEFIKGSASNLGPVSAPGLTNVSFCEYWVLDEVADPSNNNSISVTVTWDGQSPCGGTYITNLAGLTLAHFNGTSWDSYGGTATGNTTAGSITRTAVTTFSPFSLGNTISGANPLPVKFSNIKAYEKQTGIQIDWTAYDEVNVDQYYVERSADGQNFTTVGIVAATNASMTIKYGFYDANPLPGVSFYRLKNVDLDGKSGLSNIVRVSLDKSTKDVRLYPNPTRGGSISIQSSDLARGTYKVTVYNTAGQQVTSKQFNHNGGSINQPIDLPANTQSGMYMMSMENDGVRVLSKTFVVQQ